MMIQFQNQIEKYIIQFIMQQAVILILKKILIECHLDIDWVEMWTQLSKQFSSGEMKQLFDDYVPPYKNLGATFLKAYRMSGGAEEQTIQIQKRITIIKFVGIIFFNLGFKLLKSNY